MKKAISWINNNLEQFLMSSAIWSIVLIMGLQVIMRYVFRSSLSWSEELSRYLFIWFSFLGLSHGVHAETHIQLDLTETFFPKMKKPLRHIGNLVFIVFILYMIMPGIKTIDFLMTTKQKSPALGIPMYYVYISLLIGLFLTLFRFFQIYYKKLFSKGDEK